MSFSFRRYRLLNLVPAHAGTRYNRNGTGSVTSFIGAKLYFGKGPAHFMYFLLLRCRSLAVLSFMWALTLTPLDSLRAVSRSSLRLCPVFLLSRPTWGRILDRSR